MFWEWLFPKQWLRVVVRRPLGLLCEGLLRLTFVRSGRLALKKSKDKEKEKDKDRARRKKAKKEDRKRTRTMAVPLSFSTRFVSNAATTSIEVSSEPSGGRRLSDSSLGGNKGKRRFSEGETREVSNLDPAKQVKEEKSEMISSDSSFFCDKQLVKSKVWFFFFFFF